MNSDFKLQGVHSTKTLTSWRKVSVNSYSKSCTQMASNVEANTLKGPFINMAKAKASQSSKQWPQYEQ